MIYDASDPSSLITAEAEVGIYSACYKLAMLVTILLQAYRYAAEPFFFSQMKYEEKNTVYIKVMNFFIGMVCLVFLIVSLNIDVFKHFIRNEAYWQGLPVVPILLIANVFLGIYYNQSIWYKLSGKTKFGAYIALAGAILTIVINIVFIPIYGYYASAWATFFVYGFQMLVSYFLGQRYYPIKYNLRKFFLYFGLAVGIYMFSRWLDVADTYTRLGIHNLLILSYIVLIYSLEKASFKMNA